MTGIIFDLDGTLLDTLEDLTNSVNYTMNCFGCPQRSREEVRKFIGNGAYELIRLAASEGTDTASALAVYQQHYKEHCRELTAPYKGIPEVLADLSVQWPIAIVSNKPDAAVKKLCQEFFPGIHALGQRDQCPRKPAPDMVFAAMKEIGVDSCIYIGDSEVDVETARRAGVPCISVLWGFRDRPELSKAGARCFCEDPSSLPEIITAILEGDNYGK